MTQQEFMVRTGYTPSTDEEFWAIHDEYCNSPYNMDEFCKNWAHKNARKFKTPVVKKYATEAETEKAVLEFIDKNANFCAIGRTTILWWN